MYAPSLNKLLNSDSRAGSFMFLSDCQQAQNSQHSFVFFQELHSLSYKNFKLVGTFIHLIQIRSNFLLNMGLLPDLDQYDMNSAVLKVTVALDLFISRRLPGIFKRFWFASTLKNGS